MTFELLTSATCRWSVRNIAALIEKGADFRLVDVSPDGYSAAWFTALTPFGKTPALRHQDQIVVESRIINEYVDAVMTGRRLLPTNPLNRAWARVWNGFCDEEIMRQVRLYATGDPHAKQVALDSLDGALTRLEDHLFDHGSPGDYWGGHELSLTDLTYWTLFDVLDRLPLLREARRLVDSRPRIAAWGSRLVAHPTLVHADAQLVALASPARP